MPSDCRGEFDIFNEESEEEEHDPEGDTDEADESELPRANFKRAPQPYTSARPVRVQGCVLLEFISASVCRCCVQQDCKLLQVVEMLCLDLSCTSLFALHHVSRARATSCRSWIVG